MVSHGFIELDGLTSEYRNHNVAEMPQSIRKSVRVFVEQVDDLATCMLKFSTDPLLLRKSLVKEDCSELSLIVSCQTGLSTYSDYR